MRKPHDSPNGLELLTMNSDSLVALAEATRASLHVQMHMLSTELKPTKLAESTKLLGAQSFSSIKNAIKQRPWSAAGGALAASALVFASQWKHPAPSRLKADKSGTVPSQENHFEDEKKYRNQDDPYSEGIGQGTPKPVKGEVAKVGDILLVMSKLVVGLAGGYLLERALPRQPGEAELWNNVRGILMNNRDATHDEIARVAPPSSGPLPWLALVVMAGRVLTKR